MLVHCGEKSVNILTAVDKLNMIKKIIIIAAFVLLILIIFLPSFSRMQDLKRRNQEFKDEIKFLAEKNKQLFEEKKRLIEDPVYLEKVAREKMGIAKEGEVIYRIKPMEVEEK